MNMFYKDKYVKYLLVILTVIYAILFSYYFSLHTTDFNNKIDGSWDYSLGSLRNSNQHIGSDIFFTYGPLSEKIITSVNINDSQINYVTSALLFLVIIILNTYVFFRFTKSIFVQSNKTVKLLFLSTFFALALTITTIESFFYLTLLFTIYVANNEESYYKKILLLSGIFIFSLYKFNFTFPVLVLGPIVFIDKLTIKNIAKSLYKWIPGIVIYTLLYLLMTNLLNLPGFFKYLYLGLLSSVAYSEFMSLGFDKNLKVVTFYGLIMLTNVIVFIWYLYTMHKRKLRNLGDKFIPISVAYLLVSLLAFKHAVIRPDIHLLSFVPLIYLAFSYFILAIILLYPSDKIFQENNKNLKILLGISLLLFCIISIVLISFVQYENTNGLNKLTTGAKSFIHYRSNIIMNSFYNNQLNYYSFNQKKIESKKGLSMYDSTAEETQEYLHKNSDKTKLVFYGNTTFLAENLKKNLSIQYMPYLQVYAAFPPTILDGMYIEYLSKHPDALVIAEELEPSIDERIPSHELNNFFQYLIHNYKVDFINTSKNQFVLKKYQNNYEACSIISNTSSIDNEAIYTPDIKLSSNEYIKMKVDDSDIKDKVIDTGLSVLVKKPVMTIGLINENGKFERRTTKSTLKHGISINPFYQSIRDFATNQPYVINSLVIYDDIITQSNYNITFEKCIF